MRTSGKSVFCKLGLKVADGVAELSFLIATRIVDPRRAEARRQPLRIRRKMNIIPITGSKTGIAFREPDLQGTSEMAYGFPKGKSVEPLSQAGFSRNGLVFRKQVVHSGMSLGSKLVKLRERKWH